MPTPNEAEAPEAGLIEIADFGANPGALRMLVYLPKGLSPGAPLVVVLHGCTQSAAAFDRACGWSDLASRFGFTLLLPEQRQANNANDCFNWFAVGDTRRGGGEALSIREMVDRMVTDHGLDPGRVYVDGPVCRRCHGHGDARHLPRGLRRRCHHRRLALWQCHQRSQARPAMEGRQNNRPATGWGDAVRAASPHRGPWPRVSIWHGDADPSVHPVNAERLVEQWTDLHGLASTPALEERAGGHLHRSGVHPMARRWSRATPSPA